MLKCVVQFAMCEMNNMKVISRMFLELQSGAVCLSCVNGWRCPTFRQSVVFSACKTNTTKYQPQQKLQHTFLATFLIFNIINYFIQSSSHLMSIHRLGENVRNLQSTALNYVHLHDMLPRLKDKLLFALNLLHSLCSLSCDGSIVSSKRSSLHSTV